MTVDASRQHGIAVKASSATSPLRVALAGARGIGEVYRRALHASEAYQLVAIGDVDTEPRRSLGDALDVPLYEDFRSMLVESMRSGLDLIAVALEPFQSRDLVELAGRSGLTVLHKPPFARNASEAGELLRFFPNDGPQILVPRSWHYEPALADLHHLTERIGPVHAVSARVATSDPPTGWRGDFARSGGGVLLNGAYECVDLLVEMLGIPERVHVEASHKTSAPGPRTYDTEDAVAASLRFSRDGVATLTAVRGAPADFWQVTFYGENGSATVSGEGWECASNDATAPARRPVEVSDRTPACLRAIAEALRGVARTRIPVGADHLATLATIDAAYLSTRTGAPESPRQFLP